MSKFECFSNVLTVRCVRGRGRTLQTLVKRVLGLALVLPAGRRCHVALLFKPSKSKQPKAGVTIVSLDVTFPPMHLCHLLLCQHCTCVHFRRALESQAQRCFHTSHHIGFSSTTVFSHQSSHRDTLICTLPTQPRFVAERVTPHFVNPQLAFAPTGKIFLRPSDQHLLLFICGFRASSAVSFVLNLRDAAGNHAETRTGAYIYYGDAASFRDWELHTGKTGDQCIEAMSKVCDGLRGDALVAAQEVGFDNLCEIIDGRSCGMDTLTQPHARNGFSVD